MDLKQELEKYFQTVDIIPNYNTGSVEVEVTFFGYTAKEILGDDIATIAGRLRESIRVQEDAPTNYNGEPDTDGLPLFNE